MENDHTLGYLLRYYPFEDADLIAQLPGEHWFYQRFGQLTRAPYRHELQTEFPPEGLLLDNSEVQPGLLDVQEDAEVIIIDEDSDEGKPLLEHNGSSSKADNNSPLTSDL